MGGPGSGRRKSAETIGAQMDQQTASATVAFQSAAPQLLTVTQPTGSDLKVQGKGEQQFYNRQKSLYLAQNKFEDVADLADLDALLMHELLDFRYSTQLASGETYDGIGLVYAAEEQLRQNKLAEAKVIGELKRQLGLTRASRDASTGSTADYIKELLKRAKEFGVNRNNQVVTAITLAMELTSIVETYDRSNTVERQVVGIEDEKDIVAWVRDTFIPGFAAVDLAFRESQTLWRGTL